eukprot:4228483-Pyramimonas_sp.AAC.1
MCIRDRLMTLERPFGRHLGNHYGPLGLPLCNRKPLTATCRNIVGLSTGLQGQWLDPPGARSLDAVWGPSGGLA